MQYLQDFGHVSYYSRINIDDFIDVAQAPLPPVPQS